MRAYLSEKNYASVMRETVEPYLEARRKKGVYHAGENVTLHYSVYAADEPRGTVVIVHGFTENSEKYREMIYYFLKEGYTVCIFDQRGHGYSTRTTPLDVIHVDDFDEYVEDFHGLLTEIGETLPAPRMMFCHSMGGAVGALYLIRHGGFFSRALLSSPMIAPKLGGIKLHLSRLICRIFMQRGKGKDRIFVSPPSPPVEEETVESSSTESFARFDYYRGLRAQDRTLSGGAPSYAWSYEALHVTKDILAAGAPEGIEIPVLLCSSTEDTLVKEKPQNEFISRTPHGKKLSFKTKHEIYAAKDEILYPYLDTVLDFLNEAQH